MTDAKGQVIEAVEFLAGDLNNSPLTASLSSLNLWLRSHHVRIINVETMWDLRSSDLPKTRGLRLFYCAMAP